MNFEELESLWAHQPAPTVPAVDPIALKRVVLPELKRRGRMLSYGLFTVVLGLVLSPLLAVVNYRYAPPPHPIWHWVYFSLWMVVLTVWFVGLVRQLRRQRDLVRQSADTVRALATAALTSTESEMRDYRALGWQLPPLVALQLVALALKFPMAEFGWMPWATRAAFVVGLPLLLAFIFGGHYRRNLKPQVARQREILRQLD